MAGRPALLSLTNELRHAADGCIRTHHRDLNVDAAGQVRRAGVHRVAVLNLRWDRFAVSSLEKGKRQNVTVQELFALALTLDVAPTNLLVPLDDRPYQVTPTRTEKADLVRSWVRGEEPLPGTDERTYRAEKSLADMRKDRRQVEYDLEMLELEIATEERVKHPEMSATAMKDHLKSACYKDERWRAFKQKIVEVSSAIDEEDADRRLTEKDLDIANARMNELGGYLFYLGSAKMASTAGRAVS